jgi:hypothetical protein
MLTIGEVVWRGAVPVSTVEESVWVKPFNLIRNVLIAFQISNVWGEAA